MICRQGCASWEKGVVDVVGLLHRDLDISDRRCYFREALCLSTIATRELLRAGPYGVLDTSRRVYEGKCSRNRDNHDA